MINKFILMAILSFVTINKSVQASDQIGSTKYAAVSTDSTLRSYGIDPDTFGKEERVEKEKVFYNRLISKFVAWQERRTDDYCTAITIVKCGTNEYDICAETTVKGETFGTTPNPEVVSLLIDKISTLEAARAADGKGFLSK